MSFFILILGLWPLSSYATLEASAPAGPVAPILQASPEVVKALDLSLEQFRLGSELPDPELRAIGLKNSVRLLVELRRAGVALKFDPLLFKDEQIATKLNTYKRTERLAAMGGRVKTILHVCFMAVNIACGYNFENPAASMVTGVSPNDQPGQVLSLPFADGPPTGQ